jgi:aryl-alcohol dehydrogenase-like predicted oxidoreductase
LADGSNFENFNYYISKFLEELEVDTIDTLMFHNFQDYQKNLNSIDNLRKCSTKIKKIGVSVYSNEEVLNVAIDKSIDVIQMPYNLLDNFSLRGETLKFAKEKGKIVHTRSAFLQGLFFMNHNSKNINYLNLKEDILKLRSIADELGYTINELALIYCLNNKYSDGVIIGVDSTEHLKKNVECLNIKLPDFATERIEKIIIKNYNLINPKLWV